MTKQEIFNILNPIAPAYYVQAPIGTLLPFITYETDHENNFGADDKVYQEVTGVTVTLYMRAEDLSIETELNEALKEAELFWTSSSGYDDDQKVFTTVYEMEVI